MTPERKGEDMMLTVAEAARVLGMERQGVYAAINAGRLTATGEAYGRTIKASEVIGFGIRAGRRTPTELLKALEDETKADGRELLMWVLVGLGLYALITLLGNKKD